MQRRYQSIRIHLILLIVFICTSTIVSGQYYGMKFSGIEVTLDQRSGLNLTPERAFAIKEDLDLQFHIRFDPNPEAHYGYIFRLILGNRNIDLIHGIVPSNPNTFELILGDKTSKIAFHIPEDELFNNWAKLRFVLDFKNQKISCHLNDTVLVDDLSGYDKKGGFRLMFGAHSFGNFASTDVPGMIIRDIEVRFNDKLMYRWPLNEIQGTIAHSVPVGNNGIAFNPVWLLKQHNTWKNLLNFDIAGLVKTAFDPGNDDLYLVSEDSVYIFNILNNSMNRIAQYSPSHIESPNKLIYDTISDRLILYSLDNNYLSVFDFETNEWSPHDPGPVQQTVYWQHNCFIAPDGSIIAIGGYGQHQYKNSMLAWNPEKVRFDSLGYKGDFDPRYLAGSGFNPTDSLLYIIGGYGSKSGKQSERPNYYYEIVSFSLADSTFTDVVEFSNTEAGFCFANSVVFDDSNNIYALYFPKYQFKNKLQLVRIPLGKPKITELGNPLGYSFLDVRSFTDLHFSKGINSLVAVSSYSSDDSTEVSVHSIAFPPQIFTIDAGIAEKNKSYLALYIIGIFLLFVSAYFLYYRRRRTASDSKPAATPLATLHQSNKNAISLFGGFQVIDKEGIEITAKFTPLPKQLFLFILLHSLRDDKGVSTNILNETFWFDKSVESARNNRAVNMAKIKLLLENLETASISKETGYWKFDFDPSRVQIDYFDYLRLARSSSDLIRKEVVALLTIVENKPFLYNTNGDWLDPFKSDISNEIIDAFLRYIHNSDDDPEFLLHLINCIFIYDSVNEEALKLRCRLLIKQGKHFLAKKAYSEFVKEYMLLYDEEYGMSLKEIIEEK